MVDRDQHDSGDVETAAQGYAHTPGHYPGRGAAPAAGKAPEIGGEPGGEDAFGADPGGRERFDAGAAYGADVDPEEMGGIDPSAGGATPGSRRGSNPAQ